MNKFRPSSAIGEGSASAKRVKPASEALNQRPFGLARTAKACTAQQQASDPATSLPPTYTAPPTGPQALTRRNPRSRDPAQPRRAWRWIPQPGHQRMCLSRIAATTTCARLFGGIEPERPTRRGRSTFSNPPEKAHLNAGGALGTTRPLEEVSPQTTEKPSRKASPQRLPEGSSHLQIEPPKNLTFAKHAKNNQSFHILKFLALATPSGKAPVKPHLGAYFREIRHCRSQAPWSRKTSPFKFFGHKTESYSVPSVEPFRPITGILIPYLLTSRITQP